MARRCLGIRQAMMTNKPKFRCKRWSTIRTYKIALKEIMQCNCSVIKTNIGKTKRYEEDNINKFRFIKISWILNTVKSMRENISTCLYTLRIYTHLFVQSFLPLQHSEFRTSSTIFFPMYKYVSRYDIISRRTSSTNGTKLVYQKM